MVNCFQYVTEKMGGAEGTKLDLDFMDMERVSIFIVKIVFNSPLPLPVTDQLFNIALDSYYARLKFKRRFKFIGIFCVTVQPQIFRLHWDSLDSDTENVDRFDKILLFVYLNF